MTPGLLPKGGTAPRHSATPPPPPPRHTTAHCRTLPHTAAHRRTPPPRHTAAPSRHATPPRWPQAIAHSGDEREGDEDLGQGDDEIITVDLAMVPRHVVALFFIGVGPN